MNKKLVDKVRKMLAKRLKNENNYSTGDTLVIKIDGQENISYSDVLEQIAKSIMVQALRNLYRIKQIKYTPIRKRGEESDLNLLLRNNYVKFNSY